MGKDWDKVVVGVDIWKQCHRVLKPGSFAYVMAAPRQDVLSHMVVNLEKAGFQTGFTSMYWAYATGFPKAMNVAKAVDKKLGVTPEMVEYENFNRKNRSYNTSVGFNDVSERSTEGKPKRAVATSDKAKGLDGSYAGFQPKPAVEVILVVMKPLDEKTYLEQAMKDRKGVSWFDDCRVPLSKDTPIKTTHRQPRSVDTVFKTSGFKAENDLNAEASPAGRFPANLLVSDNVLDLGKIVKGTKPHIITESLETNKSSKEKGWGHGRTINSVGNFGDDGDFSRYYDLDAWYSQFIITAKPSKKEKNKGLDHLPDKIGGGMSGTVKQSMKTGSGNERNNIMKNNHPTVKPLKLMSYLVTMGSRPTNTVLDPFAGSGTTGIACIQTGRDYILIEKNKDYYNIMLERLHGTSKQQTL
jgi:site-specific DNA-methyltransferase (adenine-specific)